MNKAKFTSYHELDKKKDNRRIWLEGEPLLEAGFNPGDFFSVALNVDTLSVELNHVPDSKEARALHKARLLKKVSRRQMVGWIKPIVDICNSDITDLFGDASRFRAQSFDGKVVFSIHPEDIKRIERENTLNDNLKNGFITKGDAFVGIGISCHAIHQGLKDAGIKTKQKWAVEIDGKYLDIAKRNSPEIYNNAHLFCASVEEVEKDLLEPVDAFSFSLPCTNHSSMGVAKKGLKSAEDGDEVTALFGTIAMIQAVNPAILISENVPNAKGSTSYNILLKELKRLGYEYEEMILDEKQGGSLELRKRYWFVAYSKGLDIDPTMLLPREEPKIHADLGDAMEKDETDLKWFPVANLTKRHDKNVASGRNFKINLVDEKSEAVSTIPRSYAKHQVSNPHITNGSDKYRLLTPAEHARVKRIPEHLIGNCHVTTAHQGLGQSIAYYHAYGIAQSLVRAMLAKVMTNKAVNDPQLPLALSA